MTCINLADTCSLVKRLGSYSTCFLKCMKNVTWFLFSNEMWKENYGEGKGRLHCFPLTNSTSVTFCDTSTVKTCCTTTVAKTMKLFNWISSISKSVTKPSEIIRKKLKNCWAGKLWVYSWPQTGKAVSNLHPFSLSFLFKKHPPRKCYYSLY